MITNIILTKLIKLLKLVQAIKSIKPVVLATLYIAIVLAIVPNVTPAYATPANQSSLINHIHIPKNLPNSTTQLIVVTQHNPGIAAQITLLQKNSNQWQQSAAIPPISAVVGSEGITSAAQKIEGDNKTPAGLYKLGPAYGTKPLALKMDYRYITNQDKFIDDPKSKDYNTWVVGNTSATSYEAMNLGHGAYDLGLVINYNMNPVIPGKGSAIFMHIWESSTIGTHGCVAMAKPNMLKLLKWLDKNSNPYILITLPATSTE